MKFDKVTPEHIRQYRNDILKSSSASTFDRKIFSLKKFFEWAVKEGFVDENPVEVFLKQEADAVETKVVRIEKQKKTYTPSYGSLQSRIIAKLAGKPKIQKIIYNVFYTRPKWYQTYHSLPIASYFNYAILVILMSGLGFGIYTQFFKTTSTPLAYPTSLTRAGRYLSFQGRLTNILGNPITSATNVDFKLYNASASGTLLWDSGVCSITPDTDGIFSTLLGSSCGTEIAASVFSENAGVWLGVTVGADIEASPRVQIATVAYALNSETLQGYPASAAATANTVPVMNNSGQIVLAVSSPKIQSTSGNFAVEGQAITLDTPSGSNGSINIAPDGTGSATFTFSGATPGNGKGMLYATDANLNSKALIYGSVTNDSSGYNLLELASGTTPRTKFAIDSAGNATLSGTINGLGISGGNITSGSWLGNLIGTQYGGTGANNSTAAQYSIPYYSATGVLGGAVAPSTAGYVLSTNSTGGAPSWIPTSGIGTNYWQLANHVLAPSNALDDDLAIGGNSTASAKLLINAATGNLISSGNASISGSLTFAAGAGSIQSTNKAHLTLGGTTTGGIDFGSPITSGTWNGSAIGAIYGGTGQTVYAIGDILYADTTTSLAKLSDVATGNVLISGGTNTAPSWGKVVLGTHTTGNYVSSINGTANQISANVTTGDVTLSIPSDFRAPGTVNAVNGLYTGATAGTQRIDASGNLVNIANISASGYATISASLAVGTGTALAGPGNINASGKITGTAIYQGANQVCDTSGNCSSIGNYWQLANHVLAPANAADYDLAIGGNSTASAKFQVFAANGNLVTSGTASVSGNLTLGNGSAFQSAYGPLTLNYKSGANTWAAGLTLEDINGYVGIGTTSPLAALDVNGAASASGSLTFRSGAASIQTTSLSNLTIGGSTTGNVIINSKNSTALTANGANLTAAGIVYFANGTTYYIDASGNANVANGTITGNTQIGDATTDTLTIWPNTWTLSNSTPNLDLKNSTVNALSFETSLMSFDTSNTRVGINNTAPTATLDVAGAASVSGSLTFRTGAGSIQTTAMNPLTIGGATSGNITLNPSNAAAGGSVTPNTTNVTDLGTASLLWRNVYATKLYQGANQVCDTSGNCGGTNYWGLTNGALYPLNNSVDLLLGSTATTSAKFAFTGVLTGTPTASISGSVANVATYLSGNGVLSTTNLANLTLGSSTTGNVIINSKGSTALTVSGANLTAAGIVYFANGTTYYVDASGNANMNAGTFAGTLTANGNTQIGDATSDAFTVYPNTWNLTNSQPNLDLKGATINAMSIETSLMSFDTSNTRVGIGTTSPTSLLDVAGAASVSGSLSFRTGAGSIQTTAMNPLTIGGATSGNITLNPSNAAAGGFVAPNTTNVTDLGTASLLWRNVYATSYYQGVNQVCDISGNCTSATDYWSVANGVIYPKSTSVDLLLGSNATSSAKFAFLNVLKNTPTASISGSTANVALFMDGNGNISTTNRANLTLGNSATYNTTGNILLNPNGTGNVGIGNTSTPIAKLQVIGDIGYPLGNYLYLNGGGAALDNSWRLGMSGATAPISSALVSNNRINLTIGSGSTDGFVLGINGSNSVMEVNGSGTMYVRNNLGIGTTTPTALLDAAGDASASGALVLRGAAPTIDILNGYDFNIQTSPGGDIGLTSRLTILNSNGNVGIGTAAPQQALDVNGYIRGQRFVDTSSAAYYVDPATATVSAMFAGDASMSGSLVFNAASINTIDILNGARLDFQTSVGGDAGLAAKMTLLNNGYLGIGTVTPNAILDIAGDASTSGSLVFKGTSPSTIDILNGNRLDFQTSVGGDTGLSAVMTILNNGNVGIGTISPTTLLGVGGTTGQVAYFATGGGINDTNYITVGGRAHFGYDGNNQMAALQGIGGKGIELIVNDSTFGATASAAMVIKSTGLVGIGTTSPQQALDVNGYIRGQRFIDTSSGAYYIDPAAATVSAFLAGNIVNSGAFSITTNGSNGSITIDAGSGDVIIGDGSTSKLNAGTIDPPYTINGSKYATYVSSMTGVKEETTGTAMTSEFIPGQGYRTSLDFANAADGSDLWVFSNVTKLSQNANKLVVLLSPAANTKAWYSMDPSGKLYIYTSQPTTVSYRLTAPRFDAEKWQNTRDNGVAGFTIDNTNTWPALSEVPNMEQIDFNNYDLVASAEGTQKYNVVNSITGQLVQDVTELSQAIIGNIKAGVVVTKDLASNTFTSFQGTVDNMLIKSGLVAGRIQTKLISPLADSTDVTVQIGSEATPSGKFAIQNSTGSEVASIDNNGNATFSGTLYADQINSKSLDDIQNMLTQVKADQDLLAQASNWSINSTNSASLNQIATADLYVTNQAAVNSLSVTNSLTIGTDMVFGSSLNGQGTAINSLDTLTSPLKIQSLAMAPVEIMAGLIKIDTKGNVEIAGNLAVAGNVESAGLTLKDNINVATNSANLLTLQNSNGNTVSTVDASGSATFNNIMTQGLTIAGATANATSSSVVNGVITTNATAGSAVIPAGTSEITIKNNNVTDYTLVYVTPTSSTNNYVLYVKSKGQGQFVVGFTNTIDTDVNFNWWIVKVSQ